MNILFLTNKFPTSIQHKTLEKELILALAKQNIACTVANIHEKKYGEETHLEYFSKNIELLQIQTGDIFNNVGFLKKKINVLQLPHLFKKSIKKYLKNKHFDLIVTYGPYLSDYKLIKYLKELFKCKTVLIQWDIFPQNAYDLGVIKNKFIFEYLKYKQQKALKQFDLILCNSEGNIKYLIDNFKFITNDKLYLLPNCEADEATHTNNSIYKNEIRNKYNIPVDSTTLIFGGNIGIPQALENIITIANSLSYNNKIFFVILGQGTEANKIKESCKNKHNIMFLPFVDKKEYDKLVYSCDYGIVSLSPKFTVPNFPAKVTSYVKNGLPIFACLDACSYDDLGQLIIKNNIGYAVKAESINSNIENIIKTLSNNANYNIMRSNARSLYDKMFNIDTNISNLVIRLNSLITNN